MVKTFSVYLVKDTIEVQINQHDINQNQKMYFSFEHIREEAKA
jgi:hypothetical protein